MRTYSLLIIGILSLFISACVQLTPKIEKNVILSDNPRWIQLNAWSDVSLEAPGPFQEKIIRDDDSLAFTTYDTSTTERSKQDYSVHFYHTTPSCSPSSLGISEPETMVAEDGESVMWGRVDFWDITDALYQRAIQAEDPRHIPPAPLCIPPFPHSMSERMYVTCTEEDDCFNKQRKYELDHEMYSAYALCSEKDGKTVLICISQITDNPALAEEIFETFQWTE